MAFFRKHVIYKCKHIEGGCGLFQKGMSHKTCQNAYFFLNGGTNIQRGLLQVLFNIVKMSLTSKVNDTFGYFAKTGSCYVRI